MEVTKISEIKNFEYIKKSVLHDIRQSNQWVEFFKQIGWNSFTLSNGSNFFYIKTILGTFAKTARTIKLTQKDIDQLDQLCKKHKISFLKLDPSIDQDIQLLKNNNFIKNKNPLAPTIVQMIDLTNSLDDIFKDFSKSAKYGIKRGIKEKTKVDFIKNPTTKQLQDFYYKVQKPRADKTKYNVPNVNETIKRTQLFKENVILSFFYNNNNQLCGGKLYYLYKDMAYYIFGGTTEIGAKDKSGYVQMWESIKYFKNLNIKVLNLDGIFDTRYKDSLYKWKGFSDFKLKFGGKLIIYPDSYTKFYGKIYNKLPLNIKQTL